jgi:hypothetical protein
MGSAMSCTNNRIGVDPVIKSTLAPC